MIVIDKPEGLTPLQALDAFRTQYSEYASATLSYAGRLDPMASGVLPVLVGEENKDREKYLGLDKEYEFEVLFGVSTDTYDVLGLIQEVQPVRIDAAPHCDGTFTQSYPAYSSKTVRGKPLHEYARGKRLDEIEIPHREVTVYSLSEISKKEVLGAEIVADVTRRIARVAGDFRQQQIVEEWNSRVPRDESFTIVRYRAAVSSGTYIRSLAVRLGNSIGIPALAYSIRRTRVGPLTLKDPLRY